jgi:hypothetical protein
MVLDCTKRLKTESGHGEVKHEVPGAGHAAVKVIVKQKMLGTQ